VTQPEGGSYHLEPRALFPTLFALGDLGHLYLGPGHLAHSISMKKRSKKASGLKQLFLTLGCQCMMVL